MFVPPCLPLDFSKVSFIVMSLLENGFQRQRKVFHSMRWMYVSVLVLVLLETPRTCYADPPYIEVRVPLYLVRLSWKHGMRSRQPVRFHLEAIQSDTDSEGSCIRRVRIASGAAASYRRQGRLLIIRVPTPSSLPSGSAVWIFSRASDEYDMVQQFLHGDRRDEIYPRLLNVRTCASSF